MEPVVASVFFRKMVALSQFIDIFGRAADCLVLLDMQATLEGHPVTIHAWASFPTAQKKKPGTHFYNWLAVGPPGRLEPWTSARD